MRETKSKGDQKIDVDAMLCWHYVAPLIPVSSNPESASIYFNTFKAFQLLEAEQKKEKKQ